MGVEERLEELCNDWVKEEKMVADFSDQTWNKESIRRSIEEVIPQEYSFIQYCLQKGDSLTAREDKIEI